MIGVLHELLDKIGDEDIIIDVIPASEEHHPASVSALMILIKIVGHNDVYTVPVDCYDFQNNVSRNQAESFFSELSCNVYCFSKKKILHLINIDRLLDLSLKMFLMTGEIIDECDYETAAHRFFKNTISNHRSSGRVSAPRRWGKQVGRLDVNYTGLTNLTLYTRGEWTRHRPRRQRPNYQTRLAVRARR